MAGVNGLGWAWRRVTKSRPVVLNLKSGESVKGLLVRTTGALLELRQAETLADGRVVPMDGTAVIDSSNVAFAQVLDAVPPPHG